MSRVLVAAATLAMSGVCAAAAVPAHAQGDADAVEPKSGSPSGAVYEIPLEGARKDAAPRQTRRGAGSHGGAPPAGGTVRPPGGGAATGEPQRAAIQSENGFGSSSTVPGTTDRAKAAGGGGLSSRDTGEGAGVVTGGGGAGGGGTGGGAARPVADHVDAVDPVSAVRANSLLGGTGSATVPIAVLLLAIVAGAGLAVAFRRRPS